MRIKQLIFLSLITRIYGFKENKVCGVSNLESIYLQSGESGRLILKNDDLYKYKTSKCSVELVTCPLCSIQLTFDNGNNICEDYGELCTCGKITIQEINYEKKFNLCDLSNDTFYKGHSKSLLLLHDESILNASSSISVIYTSIKNQNLINGPIGSAGSFSSLNFPISYPRNHGSEQVLLCDDDDCIIKILFTDFLISSTSIIEVFDWDGSLVHFITGSKTRPPYISSTGPTLTIRFLANGGSYMGYKADYYYIKSTQDFTVNTECGGEVRNLGGYIYMDEITGYYDCFWIIKPSISISYLKTHLYLKVLNFTGTGEVRIHNGITSESNLVAILTNDSNKEKEYITSISKSFYVSYKGYPSKLLISYTTFSYIDCLTGLDYMCNNNRCIIFTLVCDTIDHCGDNSDEIKDCSVNTFITHRYWWPLRNSDLTNDEDAKQFSSLWMCGIIVVIAILLLVSTTCHRSIRIRPINTNQLDVQTTNEQIRTITQLLTEEETNEDDNPPVYEPPPDYSQVINLSNQNIDLHTKSYGSNNSFDKASSSYVALDSDVSDIIPNHDNAYRRKVSEISLPISLETDGYDEDLGVSLTISVATNKDLEQKRLLSMTKQTRQNISHSTNTCNFSALSFDTLHSSEEIEVNTRRHLVKSQSQDNLTSTSNNFNSKLNYNYNQLF